MPQNPYTPTDFEPLVMEQFEGINTLTTRAGIPDNQMAWCDGFMPIAARNLYTLRGLGSAIFTATGGRTIVKSFFDLSQAYSVLSDGSVWVTQIATSLSSQIAAPTTLGAPTPNSVGFTKSGVYVIVVSTQVNGYNIIAPGLPPIFYSPGLVVPGLGTVPTGIFGNTVETYTGRIWVANGPVVGYSAPGSLIDFSAANGGGFFQSMDSFLRSTFAVLISSNGFLYCVGDHSVNYISGVQTSGTPPVTTFTNQNADPDVGTPWVPSVVTWGREIIIPNLMGIFKLSGGSVTKVSEALDGVYRTSNFFATFTPSAAKAVLTATGGAYNKTVYLLLYPIIDPVSGVEAAKLLMWDGKRWWTSPQDLTLTFITTWGVNGTYVAYGCDGASLYPLFQTPSNAFAKVVRSKYWDKPGSYTHNKSADRFWSLWNYGATASTTFTIGIDAASINRSTGNMADTTNTYTIAGPSSTGSFVSPPQAIAQQGLLTGMTITTHAADAQLISAAMAPNVEEYRG